MNERSPAVRAISHRQLEDPRIEESSEVFCRPSFPPGVHGANPYPILIGQQGVVGGYRRHGQCFAVMDLAPRRRIAASRWRPFGVQKPCEGATTAMTGSR